MKMYIAVLDEFPDFMTPTLVAHAVLGHHHDSYVDDFPWLPKTAYQTMYDAWFYTSFKKVVLRVNQKEFDKISQLENVGLFHENNTLEGKKACAVIVVDDEVPNVLKFAKVWKPLASESQT